MIDSWIVYGIAAVLILVFVTMDHRSRSYERRVLRWTAIAVMTLSLACLYIKPSTEISAPKSQAFIPTTGADLSIADSLRKAGVLEVANVEEIDFLEANIIELLVLGDGLTADQIEKVKVPVSQLDKSLPSGVRHLDPVFPLAGRSFNLTGSLRTDQEVSLQLNGAGSSWQTRTEDDFSFELSVPEGHHLFDLLGVSGGDTLFKEKVPVIVAASPSINVLMLSSHPSFEHRYLKNHLASLGLGIASKSQIGQSNYRTEFVNMSRLDLDRINTSLLDNFDLIVGDVAWYEEVNSATRRNIEQSMSSGDLGLILINPDRTSEEIEINYESGTVSFPAVQVKSRSDILFTDTPIGSQRKVGIGSSIKLGITNTYQAILKGHEQLYSDLWSHVINSALGFQQISKTVFSPVFNRTNEPMEILFYSEETNPELVVNGIRVPPISLPQRPQYWKATFWPDTTGWVDLVLNQTDTSYAYIQSGDSWVTMRKSHRLEIFDQHQSFEKGIPQAEKMIESAISRWIFFGLFLLSAGYLWLEQRLFS